MRYHSIYKTCLFAFQKETHVNLSLQITSHQSLAWDVIAYFRHVSLLFKKRAMPTRLYNEHHIAVWHGITKTNIFKSKTPMCCYN